MKLFLLFLLSFTMYLGSTKAQQDFAFLNTKSVNHSEFKGSPFWIILPDGYYFSDMHAGFVNKNGSHTNLQFNKTTKSEFTTFWKNLNAQEKFTINGHNAVKRLFKDNSGELVQIVIEVELETNIATFIVNAKSKGEFEQMVKCIETMYI